jgi:hypothetical protein
MTPATIARGAGRVALALLVALVVALCGLQFEIIVAKNVALARELSASRERAERLGEHIRAQQRAIVRLNSPDGAIPEIHDELQLVGPREEVIYLRGAGAATPEPEWTAP